MLEALLCNGMCAQMLLGWMEHTYAFNEIELSNSPLLKIAYR